MSAPDQAEPQEPRVDELRLRDELRLLEQLRRLSAEDHFAGTMCEVGEYPEISRALSPFEMDLRDWGLVFGVAFGIAINMWPDEPRPELARRAYWPARMAYVRGWGDIADPVAKRDAARSEEPQGAEHRAFVAIDDEEGGA